MKIGALTDPDPKLIIPDPYRYADLDPANNLRSDQIRIHNPAQKSLNSLHDDVDGIKKQIISL